MRCSFGVLLLVVSSSLLFLVVVVVVFCPTSVYCSVWRILRRELSANQLQVG